MDVFPQRKIQAKIDGIPATRTKYKALVALMEEGFRRQKLKVLVSVGKSNSR